MDNFSDWLQSNWYELGNLLFQFAILATLAWFGRGVLSALSSSRSKEQDEAPSRPVFTQLSPDPEPGHGRGIVSAWSGMITWLNTPMSSGGEGPVRRMKKWLQEPMGN